MFGHSFWTGAGIFQQSVPDSRPNNFYSFLMFSWLLSLFTCLPAKSWCWDVLIAHGLLSGWHGSTAAQPHFSPSTTTQMLGCWPRVDSTMAIPNVSQESLFSSHPPQPCNSASTNSSPPFSQRALVLVFISSPWKLRFQPRYMGGSSGSVSREGYTATALLRLSSCCFSSLLLTLGTVLFSVVGLFCAL